MEKTTIAAIATSPGVGGIGIIRISGEEAFSVVAKIFRPKDAFFDVINPKPNVIKYGYIYDGENKIISFPEKITSSINEIEIGKYEITEEKNKTIQKLINEKTYIFNDNSSTKLTIIDSLTKDEIGLIDFLHTGIYSISLKNYLPL